MCVFPGQGVDMWRKPTVLLATLAAVLVAATGALAGQPRGSATATSLGAFACKSGYYKNASGRCVHRPVKASKAPPGATAHCRDGTWSFSQHASGTCSHHGGVAVWIHHP